MKVFIGKCDEDSDDRIEKIKIHHYDIWSMHNTLAPIILPMLKLLKDNITGSPYIDNADVPEELRKTEDDPDPRIRQRWTWQYNDELNYDRWNWVLDEMIWAFEQKVRDNWALDYTETVYDDPDDIFGFGVPKYDEEGIAKHHARMTQGFTLFGKYFEKLYM